MDSYMFSWEFWYGSPREAIASRGGSVPEFQLLLEGVQEKPIATCDFLGGSDPMSPPLDTPAAMYSQ